MEGVIKACGAKVLFRQLQQLSWFVQAQKRVPRLKPPQTMSRATAVGLKLGVDARTPNTRCFKMPHVPTDILRTILNKYGYAQQGEGGGEGLRGIFVLQILHL